MPTPDEDVIAKLRRELATERERSTALLLRCELLEASVKRAYAFSAVGRGQLRTAASDAELKTGSESA